MNASRLNPCDAMKIRQGSEIQELSHSSTTPPELNPQLLQ